MKKILIAGSVLFGAMMFSSMLLASVIKNQGPASVMLEPGPVLPMPQASDLTDDQLLEIGIKIWQNQCGVWDRPGKVTHDMKQGITDWEADYAQIGIDQCIWYPADQDKIFQEDWPRAAQALKDKGYPIEDWMLGACAWNNSEEFFADFNGDRLKSLRKMLAKRAIIIEQAHCIATRLDESLDKMKVAIDTESGITEGEKTVLKQMVSDHFYKVATDDYPRGLYALMDYVHFKGEGVLPAETINGVGWGLRQALEQMDDKIIAKKGAVAAFVNAAITMFPSRKTNEYFKDRMETYLSFNPDKVSK